MHTWEVFCSTSKWDVYAVVDFRKWIHWTEHAQYDVESSTSVTENKCIPPANKLAGVLHKVEAHISGRGIQENARMFMILYWTGAVMLC